MSDRKPSKRVSLSKSQLQDGIGAELFSLCQGITADGKLSKDEIVVLGQWLNDNQNADLPGIGLLTETLKRIIADGRVSRDEQRELSETIEKILPPDARRGAKAARKEIEANRKAAEKTAREQRRKQELEQQWRREPEDEFDFMVAGVHFDGRHHLVEQYLSVGDRVLLQSEPDNPRDECAVAVTLTNGRQIGFVPRDDSEDVAGCIEVGGYYVAKVKKILTGGRVPIPVIILEFYRPNQFEDISDLEPDHCRVASSPYLPIDRQGQRPGEPWWKIW